MRANSNFPRLVLWLLFLLMTGWSSAYADTSAYRPVASAESVPAPALLTALRLLDYLSRDYPRSVDAHGTILDQDEWLEQQELSAELPALLAQLLPEESDKWQEPVQRLRAAIGQHAPPDTVLQAVQAVTQEVLMRFPDPRALPPSVVLLDKAQTAALYQKNCAACHGPQGDGQGPLSQQFPPPSPVNFLDVGRAAHASVWGYQQSIAHGVQGTAMRAFQELSVQEQWSLADYVLTLSRDKGRDSWERVYYGLEQTLAAYIQGDYPRAKQLAIQAYLEGFEPLEVLLDANGFSTMRKATETAMLRLRQYVQSPGHLTEVEDSVRSIERALQDAHARIHRAPPAHTDPAERAGKWAWEPFAAACLILWREGLEALLVLASLLAIVRRLAIPRLVWAVYMAGFAALLAGGVTWWIAQTVFAMSGMQRELLEGLTACLAALTLMGVGIWLHSQHRSQQWQKRIQSRLQEALQAGSWRATGLLGTLVFTAVYREVFETVLFYQTLWQAYPDNRGSLGLGVLVGLVGLLVLAVALFGLSARLPLGLWFTTMMRFMGILAVIFWGQGIYALQEAGWVPFTALAYVPTLPYLGLHPSLEGCAIQLGTVLWMARALRQPKKR